MIKTKPYILGLLSGALLGFSFPPFPFYWIAFVGFVPLLYALAIKEKRFFLLTYLTFWVYHGITAWWIGSWQPIDSESQTWLRVAGIAVWLVHPFFFCIPIFTFRLIKKKMGLNIALWLFPFLWSSFEWLHSLFDIAFPWLTVGYTQIYNNLWVQFADIFGVWGLSFLITLVNVIIFKIIIYIIDNQIKTIKLNLFLIQKKIIYYVISILLIIALPMLYGAFRINDFNHEQLLSKNETINIAIIQPNINPWEKWQSRSNVIRQIRKHLYIQDSLLKKSNKLDLFIWSETAIPNFSDNFNTYHKFEPLTGIIDSLEVSILTGFADIKIFQGKENLPVIARPHWDNPNNYYVAYNAALIINPQKYGTPFQIYHKMKLTPISERIPFVEMFSFLIPVLDWGVGISNWEKGSNQYPLYFDNGKKQAKIGSIICIESIYPYFVSNFADLGANVLVIITNDGWYDNTFGPEQHYQIGCMRAIENRRYIARCANTGVSGFISPIGKSILTAPLQTQIGIAQQIPLIDSKTIYTYIGDILPIFCLIISILMIIYSLTIKRIKQSNNF